MRVRWEECRVLWEAGEEEQEEEEASASPREVDRWGPYGRNRVRGEEKDGEGELEISLSFHLRVFLAR